MEERKARRVYTRYVAYIPKNKRLLFKSAVKDADDSSYQDLMEAKVKSTTASIWFSILFGYLGVDRFYVRNVGLGFLKMIITFLGAAIMGTYQNDFITILTAMLIGAWWIADMVLCRRRVMQINYPILMSILGNQSEQENESDIESDR